MRVDKLAAKLFSIDGKRQVTLTEMSALSASMRVEGPPAAGSIAVLVRHGLRICGTVCDRTEEQFVLEFDHPITARELELFWGGAAETVAVHEHSSLCEAWGGGPHEVRWRGTAQPSCIAPPPPAAPAVPLPIAPR